MNRSLAIQPSEFAASIGVATPEFHELSLPSLRQSLDPHLPRLAIEAPMVPQRYLIEIWVEKSTINDIILPLHRMYGVNVVTGIGEMSEIRCRELVERAIRHRRPVRILYISDFDPAGASMPVAVARKIQHHVVHADLDLDIQLRPIALTHAQCQHYRLPRTPIKATETRAATFEARFGEGATELDALVALHPGVMREIIEREIRRYHDGTLPRRVAEAVDQIERDLEEINEQVAGEHDEDIAELQEAYADLAERFNAAAEPFRAELREIRERHQAIMETVAGALAEQASGADYEWPEPEDADEDEDPLYDSTRSYS